MAPQAATAQSLASPLRARYALWATRTLPPYLFILPFFLTFAVFLLWPIAVAFWLSFQRYSANQATPVGWANYVRLFSDPFFFKALWNTLLILAFQVPFMLALALLVAVALNSPLLKLKPVYRFGYFFPLVMGTVPYSIVFRLLFDHEFGIINHTLRWLGLAPVGWSLQPLPAQLMIAIALTWRWTGYNAIIMLAGLQGISRDFYEAASIDGANTVQQFCHLTVPLLKPVLLFTLTLSIIGTLQLFTEPFLLTNGAPANATLTLGLYLYRQGFQLFNFGYASAIAYAVAILTVVLSLVQLIFFRERR